MTLESMEVVVLVGGITVLQLWMVMRSPSSQTTSSRGKRTHMYHDIYIQINSSEPLFVVQSLSLSLLSRCTVDEYLADDTCGGTRTALANGSSRITKVKKVYLEVHTML